MTKAPLYELLERLETKQGRARYRRGESVPMKYLSGYKGKDREARIKRIEKMKALAKSGAPSSVLDNILKDKGKTAKESKWTKAFKKEYGEGGSLEKIAKLSKISLKVIEEVYARGVQAARTSGRRPNATPQQWGLARVYAFIMKAKHHIAPLDHDIDLAEKLGFLKVGKK